MTKLLGWLRYCLRYFSLFEVSFCKQYDVTMHNNSRLTLSYLVIQAESHAKMKVRVTINASCPYNSLWVFLTS